VTLNERTNGRSSFANDWLHG